MKVSIVVPVYNSALMLKELTQRINKTISNLGICSRQKGKFNNENSESFQNRVYLNEQETNPCKINILKKDNLYS